MKYLKINLPRFDSELEKVDWKTLQHIDNINTFCMEFLDIVNNVWKKNY